jgi:PKD repeat protein
LPAPAALPRQVTYAADGLVRTGAALELGLPHHQVIPSGNALDFLPNYSGPSQQPGGLAYAAYVFQADGYDRLPQVQLNWQTPPASGQLFIGLADFTANRWQWFASDSVAAVSVPSLAPFIAPDGQCDVLVAVSGALPAELTGLRLGGLPPVSTFSATPDNSVSPLTPTFTYSATDADGSVVSYQIDFEEDGVFDFNDTAPGSTTHDYLDNGPHYARLRVTDNDGQSTDSEVLLIVNSGSGAFPGPILHLSDHPAQVPVTIQFDAGDSLPGDSPIVDYAFDLDGDGIFEQHGLSTTAEHTYQNAGSYAPRLRVVNTDGRGATLGTSPIQLVDSTNHAPLAELRLTRETATFPETFRLDASQSYDSDGTVATYQWDFDGDGNFDQTGPAAVVEHAYYQQGSFLPAVRVTDNDHGTDSAVDNSISISGGWQTLDVAFYANPQETSLLSIPVGDAALLGLAFTLGGDNRVEFMSASSTDLTDWSFPTLVGNEDTHGTIAVLNVGDSPAVLYQRSGAFNVGGLSYIRATNSTGTTWGSPVNLDKNGAAAAVTINALMVGGRPAVAYGNSGGKLNWLRASDALGAAWPASPTLIRSSGAEVDAAGAAIINDRPAVLGVHGAFAPLYYSRADDSTGTTWPNPPLTLVNGVAGTYVQRLGLTAVDGNPAAAYSASGLFFQRSSDSDGTAWGAGLPVISTTDSFRWINLLAGPAPAIVCQQGATDLIFVPALDADGASWGTVQQVDTAGAVGQSASAVMVGSTVVISYVDVTRQRIKVAFLAQP